MVCICTHAVLSMPHLSLSLGITVGSMHVHHLYFSVVTCMCPFRAFPDDYSKDLLKAHTESLYKGLLIHLDDPSSAIQVNSVFLNKAVAC